MRNVKQSRNKVMDYIKNKLYRDRKYVISLIVTADCNKNCLDNALKKKRVCNNCKNKIMKELNKYYSNDKTNFEDDTNKIKTLFGLKGTYKGGHRFILEIPPKSFRNLKKKSKRLKAYRKIVKFRMKNKKIKKISKKHELLLYLGLHIKDYYGNTDCDNMAKSVTDALEGILYVKDFQIKTLIVEKIKVNKKINEGIVLSIKKI
jgi:Holliday junction resolvase RusA-like endonuclease